MKSKRIITKHYSNDEVSVVWQPHLCIHSAICFQGLPKVFDPARKPWVNPRGAGTQEIRDQVGRCPSGALSIGEPRPPEAEKRLG